ncbi:hypothetical protein FACUT_9180 [Fusarium acutatum]|uniref:CBM-cenC domain-containing protein n=1 Tax=Fusarium acutatum TaxID=78861 RepID=A0A8H4JI04_9HYPO|nr:hypothetical protein FACUT_9180 [Fusarium acutatum]
MIHGRTLPLLYQLVYSIASDASTTVGSTTAPSFVDTTTVGASSTLTSNEESRIIVTELSSTERSQNPEETSTTALSTTNGITTEIATTAEAATPTDTATTSEVPSAIPFISNAGLDDYASSIAPWELYTGGNTAFVVSDVTHDGPNSAFMIQGQSPLIDFIRQPLQGSLTAGATYTMSAWVNANSFCPAVVLICSYQNNYWEEPEPILLTTSVNQWAHVFSTCTYTQEQIDSGDLYFMIGFQGCSSSTGRGYIDKVDFSAV